MKRKIELSKTQRKLRRLDEKVRLVSICRIILLKGWELYILCIEFEGSRKQHEIQLAKTKALVVLNF